MNINKINYKNKKEIKNGKIGKKHKLWFGKKHKQIIQNGIILLILKMMNMKYQKKMLNQFYQMMIHALKLWKKIWMIDQKE